MLIGTVAAIFHWLWLAMLCMVATSAPATAQDIGTTVGARFPDFEVESLSGGIIALSALLSNGPILVQLWPGLCPTCLEDARELGAFARIQPDAATIVIVDAATDDDWRVAVDLLKSSGVPEPWIHRKRRVLAGDGDSLPNPGGFVVDASGMMLAAVAGPTNWSATYIYWWGQYR